MGDGEWDPVAGADDSDGSGSEEYAEDEHGGEKDAGGGSKASGVALNGDQNGGARDPKKWVQREEELVDGTKDVGFWIEGKEARVRVDLR